MAGGIIQQSRGGGRRRSHRPLAEINVTPLVDVMLVLLIVFMVTAPLLNNGVHVDLPKSKAAPLQQEDDKPLQISIDAKGQIFLQDTPIAMDQLVPKLNAVSQENHDAKIYIRGDRSNSWGTMMEVWAPSAARATAKSGWSPTRPMDLPPNANERRPRAGDDEKAARHRIARRHAGLVRLFDRRARGDPDIDDIRFTFFKTEAARHAPMISVELVQIGKQTTTNKVSPVNKVVKQPEEQQPAPPTPPPPQSEPTPPKQEAPPEPQPTPQPRPEPQPAPKLEAVDNTVPELKVPDMVIKPTFRAAPKLPDVDTTVPELTVPPKVDFKKVPPKPKVDPFDALLKNLTKDKPQPIADQPPVPQAKTPPKRASGAQAPISASLTASKWRH